MSGNLALGLLVLSVLYSLGLNILFFTKQHVNTTETKIFSYMLGINFVGLLLEIACILTIILMGTTNIISVIVNKIFLVYHILFTYMLFLYVLLVILETKLKEGNSARKMIRYTGVVVAIISIVAASLPITLVLSDKGCYSSGLSVNAVYGFVTVALFVTIILLIKNRKIAVKNKKKLIPLLAYLFGMSIVSAIQRYNPFLTLSTEMETFLVFLMYNTIENPDVKMVQELEIAKETADKANDSKTEFLSSMSHEIRTPLNAIVGFSDCIMDAKSIDEAKENAKDIVNASQTLLEIVNGILDISKIEAGKMEIVNTKYNAKEVFLELAKLITPRMKEKGLDFSYSIDPNLPAVLFGDKANIKKIVTNFLSNACKYTDHGFVRYEVHCVKLGDYCRLIISVEDSGRGIKKESVDKLFTRFQRLDEDRNTTIEGTGLGLAITKQLTELMGGKVIVHTVYGQGSKFTAVINQKIESMDAVEEMRSHTTLDLTDVRILIVDDAALNLKVATKLFQKYNANRIDTCLSGFECLEKVKTGNEYDLIFMDDMMPKMSGIETFSKLKQIPNYHIPTIALTANAITGMREKYLSVGFDDYLAKPIEQNELIRACNVLLGRTKENKNPSIPEIVQVEEVEEEKSEVIPVEDNIEEIIGDAANMDGQFKSAFSDEDIEILDLEPEATAASTVSLIPVIDLDVSIPNTEEAFDRSYLEKNGVDVNHALEMLGDMEMYNSTVHDFVSEVEEKWQRLNDYLAQGDMENYAIDVHSLKSDCKYLGFMTLADIAYDHELKSKEKNLEYVKEHFNELEDEYQKTLAIAKKYAEHNPADE